jgi:predicted dehydrogenase
VGCNGMGEQDLSGIADLQTNVVALCDVDWDNAKAIFNKYPNVPRFKDYRKMLDKMGDKIDAVMVSIPDHNHAVVSMAAMEQGKHIFCQKPLAHDIYEVRAMTRAARKYGVASMMGIQGHSMEGIRLMDEWMNIYNVIGKVHEVHIWTDRLGWNSQWHGRRPTDTPPIPPGMGNDGWDLWLGPAPVRPYNKSYHPAGWRAFWDFGCGALGDIGCHSMDAPFQVLKLGYPTLVTAINSNRSEEISPESSVITYDFAARGQMPPVKMIWYDGGKKPPVPAEFEKGQKLEDNGQIFVGDDGIIVCGMYGENPHIYPLKKMREFMHGNPEKKLPRSIGHYQEWIAAIKGGPRAGANFDYSGPLTELLFRPID